MTLGKPFQKGKKAMKLLLIQMMLLSYVFNGINTPSTKIEEPSYPTILCPECETEVHAFFHYGSEETVEKECPHKPYGSDEYHQRKIYIEYICPQCQHLIVEETDIEIKFVDCHGWF